MPDQLFVLDRNSEESLQLQIRRQLVNGILGGSLPPGAAVPSSRKLATQLKVSRITVTQAYQALIDDGFLSSRERSRICVSDRLTLPSHSPFETESPPPSAIATTDFSTHLRRQPTRQANIEKPANWRDYPYPFVTAQVDKALFPITAWRDCSRQALSLNAMADWTEDRLGTDDPFLIEQIRTRLLPARGIHAREDEILVTAGAQNSLFMLTQLFLNKNSLAGVENPGYPDLRNMIELTGSAMRQLEIDDQGLIPDQQLTGCDLLYITPSHQFPTTVTLPIERRRALLDKAERENIIIIEDDYEPELNFIGTPTPAIKSLDQSGRVIYVGSLSKSFFPGLRLGYLVGPAPVIREARALARLMHRHTPTNNQRTMALFLALGHHDALRKRLHRIYKSRWLEITQALEASEIGFHVQPAYGGSSIWVKGPQDLDSNVLRDNALKQGVVLEPGNVYYSGDNQPRSNFRLGYTAIEKKFIGEGIHQLEKATRQSLKQN
ncbi:PLP-dependent aminotransferase family protein [Kiloniella laminariae]|uniref:PLP-dependent aminotransferase family protein n=1 Tax=Kiloniella laminariae TaxID=454162 RepID=A0ABT4LR81_9PROT|nr:PLP-dependent aminotransferase family protein [Kiloniella laminariae]MCZ4282841.1 PLP-dependent aminotransferase family protein [Kiloniella laminariae]